MILVLILSFKADMITAIAKEDLKMFRSEQDSNLFTDFVLLCSIIRKTLYDLPCLYSCSQAILKLNQSTRGHFVTLTLI